MQVVARKKDETGCIALDTEANRTRVRSFDPQLWRSIGTPNDLLAPKRSED